MKILVVGKGGREHALVQALAESPGKPEIFCFPGSDAIFSLARAVPVKSMPALVAWMVENEIDLCVAGEESYLVKDEGLANLCEAAGIPCWGPHKQSAQLEASKEFAKGFLERHGIPTGKAVVVDTFLVGLQILGNGFYFRIISLFNFFFHLGNQFAVDFREVVDEVQRVLDFVGDACGEFAEGGEFFGLDELSL